MTKMETFENENNLEAHVEKKKKRRRKKTKKVTSSDIAEGPNVTEQAIPGPNATDLSMMKLDTPGQNEAQKRKRIHRRKRNKKLQVIEGEGVVEIKSEKDDCKNVISDSGNTDKPSEEGAVSVASIVEGATVAVSSNSPKKKRIRRRKRNKPKVAEGSLDDKMQTGNKVDSNIINLMEIKHDPSHVSEDNLNVTNVEGKNSQEKSGTQKRRRKRKNKQKVSISEGDTNLHQTSDPVNNTSSVNDLQSVSSPGKKKRNRKRRRNHIGVKGENISMAGDGSDKKNEENNDEPIVKMVKITPTECETPPSQNAVGNSPNKKRRQRNRRKKNDKDKGKPQSNIGLPHGSQENGASIMEDNEREQNRKRNLESSDENRLVGDVDSSLSVTQCVSQKNNQTNSVENSDGPAVKKTRLSLNEEDGIPSSQNVGVGSSPNKKKRQRKRKRKSNKEAAQNHIDLRDGLQENGVEVIKDLESAKDLSVTGEKGTNVNTSPSLTQSVKQEIKSEEKEGGTPAENIGAGNSSNKKKRQRNRNRKRNKDKEKAQNSVDLQNTLQENGARIISSKENTESGERDSEGKNSMLDSKNGISIGENVTVNDTIPSLTQSLEQGLNQNVLSKRKRRRNRKRKHNQNFQDEQEDKVLCGMDVAQSSTDATVHLLEPKDSTQASDDGSNSPIKMEKTKEGEVTESSACGSTAAVAAELNTLYVDDVCKNEIRKHWAEEKVQLCKDTGLAVTKEPFKCCYAPDFLKNADYLEGVKDELQDIELTMKSNDLYKFRQTSDLKNITTPYIAGLRRFLYGDFRKWLMDITGIPLNDTVDMGSSRYEYTDVLLCHDDELEGRRIAYILYLVPPWEEKDGGSLDLFTTDEHGQPKDIVKSFIPKWNAFAFFEVSPVSYHQVAEVLSCDKVRLSVNGWFHGPPIERPPKYRPPSTPLESPTHIEEEEVYSWINPTYLDTDVQREIRHKFRSDSEIELESFLAEDKYQELAQALKNSDLTWQWSGPRNKHFFQALKLDHVPAIVGDCLNFLKSEAVFLIVSQLTGLKLHRLAPESEPDSDTESKESSPQVGINVRQWSHGCYTLIRDDCLENRYALDANLFINVSDKWSQEHGGFTSYIAKDQDEELLTVVPRPNRFALVYRDTETLKFTKHINASVSELGNEDSCYNDFACVYYE